MKTLFIPIKSKLSFNKKDILETSKKLPINIVITYSIQYKELAINIKKILAKKHKILLFSQVLGCSILNLPKSTEAILLIGSGKFHALSLALERTIEADRCPKV